MEQKKIGASSRGPGEAYYRAVLSDGETSDDEFASAKAEAANTLSLRPSTEPSRERRRW